MQYLLGILTFVILIGICYALSENRKNIIEIVTKKKALFCFFIFYLLYGLEISLAKYFNIYGDSDIAFSTVMFSSSLFLFCMQSQISIEKNILLRKLSIIIFCGQGNVLLVNSFCNKILGYPPIISYLIVLSIMAIICTIVLYIQKQNRWKWVNFLT